MFRLFAIVFVVASIFSTTFGSAIPMWEYLSRGEKMSHLFHMFGKQVDEYCDTQAMPDCNKVLLVYGMSNLHKMNDEHLDSMDPYQRGATDIIWDAMMKGTYKATDDDDDLKDPYSTGSDALEPSVSNAGNSLGSDAAASNVAEYTAPFPGGIVSGPMVVRLMPDGRPVPGDVKGPTPIDEDHEEYKLMRAKPMPSVSDITRRIFPGPAASRTQDQGSIPKPSISSSDSPTSDTSYSRRSSGPSESVQDGSAYSRQSSSPSGGQEDSYQRPLVLIPSFGRTPYSAVNVPEPSTNPLFAPSANPSTYGDSYSSFALKSKDSLAGESSTFNDSSYPLNSRSNGQYSGRNPSVRQEPRPAYLLPAQYRGYSV